jgi:hypothetical protein
VKSNASPQDVNHLLHPPLKQGGGLMAEQRPFVGVRYQALHQEVIGEEHVLLDQAV